MSARIDEMPAGREMDVLVAERVMGDPWPLTELYFAPEPETRWPYHLCAGYKHKEYSSYVNRRLPRYSTDIAAAWEVVEKLADGPHGGFDLILDWSGGWEACFEPPGGEKYYVPNCATAPLAICCAALKAVGYAP